MNGKYISEKGLMAALVLFLTTLQIVQADVSVETLKSISIPDKIETPIGTLEFFDGVPSDTTINKLYDNLDRMRAVEVYLNNQGAG